MATLKRKQKDGTYRVVASSTSRVQDERADSAAGQEKATAGNTVRSSGGSVTLTKRVTPSVTASGTTTMPTLAGRVADTVSGAVKSTGADFSNAGGVLLDTARHLDTINSQEYRKSVQEAENAAHYREMLSRGTLDDGTVLDAAGKQRLEMLAQRAEQRAGIYREGAEATHAPISRVISGVYGTADELADSAAQDLADAKEGAGAVGSFLVDAGAAGVQLAGDIGLGLLTGGGALPVVAARSFGGSAQEARRSGADLGQQLAYGAGSAALSVATEKISNVAAPFRKAFGAGAADKLAGRLVSRFGESTAVQTMQKLSQTTMGKIAASAIGEGSEEFVEDVFQPVLQRATYDPDARFDLSDALRDAAIGAVLGGVGGAVDVGMGRVQGKENAASETEAAAKKKNPQDTVSNTNKTAGPEHNVRNVPPQGSSIDLTSAEGSLAGPAPAASSETSSPVEGTRPLNSDSTIPQGAESVNPAQQPVEEVFPPEYYEDIEREPASEPETPDMTIPTGSAADLVPLAKTLGESGRKAMTAFYDGETDTATYAENFLRSYNAGLSGRPRPTGQAIGEPLTVAAYFAGQNDAAASLTREKAAAQFAASAGKDSGLVYDSFVEQAVNSRRNGVNGETYLSRETADQINTVAKALGVRVRFADSVRGGTANAQLRGSEILVERDNPNPVMFLLGHEWTHRLQETAPEEYRAFRNFVMDEIQDEARGVLQRYQRMGEPISYEGALDEAVADYAGAMIEDGEVLEDFIRRHREDRTLLEKVRDAIRALIRRLTGAERKMAESAEGKLTAAFEAAAKQAETLNSRRDTAGHTGTDTKRNSLKEDLKNGRARKETRESFLRRAGSEGYATILGEQGETVYGYRPGRSASGGASQQNAGQIQEELTALGIDADVMEGPLLWNRDGITGTRDVSQAVTIEKKKILIDSKCSMPPKNVAGHEAFHLWGAGSGRAAYIETIEDNLLFTSPDFRYYQSAIAETYLGEEADLSDPKQKKKLFEELFAYFSGDIHEGLNDEYLRPMFRDYDAVKEAWQTLVQENSGRTRDSLKGTGNAAEMSRLRQENEALRDRVVYWKGQTRRSRGVSTDKKAVERAARDLVNSYSSRAEQADLVSKLQDLYDYIANNGDASGDLTYTVVRRRAEDIAGTLVESAVIADNELYQQYADLRKFLRGTKLTVSREESENIADFSDFRKRNFGRMNLGTGRSNVDQVYQELSEKWPEFFDEQRETNPEDQLRRISDVMDGIYTVTERNPYSADMEQAVSGVANEILEKFFDLPQARKTFADRQAFQIQETRARGQQQVQRVREQSSARIAELRRQNQERTRRAIAREKSARDRQLKALKDRYAERDAAGRERRSARELRARIIRHTSDLSRKLLRPSDKQHIPENLRGAVAAMLESINLESQYSIDPASGKRSKTAAGDPTKRTEAFRALREQYEAISKGRTDFNGVVDPDLMDDLAEVIAMKDTRLADMSVSQLATVWHTVRVIEQSVSTANKLLGKSRFADVAELAENIRQSSATKRTKGNWRGPAGWGDKLLNLDMMNPLTFLHLFGDGGDALYRELQEARDNRTSILSETVDQAQKAVGKADVEALRKKTHTFQTEGGELKLTTAQLMSLYELNKRKQARDHIYKGGIRATAQDSGVSRSKTTKENLAAALGKVDAPAAGAKVSQADVAAMLSELTEEEIKIADGLQAIMQGYLAQEGNRESMKVYGYQKFTEKDYFPISSDPHQVMDKIGDVLEGGGKRPRSIAEWGSAKGTVDKASNGLLLGDIFDVFAQHAVDMATYASHLSVMEDMNRVRNFTFRDSEGNRTGTMGDIIQRVTGQGGTAYLDKLLQDLSAGTAKDSVTGLAKLTANYKASSVGLNMRVALQQPTSYLRAAAVLDPKYLADPRVLKKGGWEKALKNAPIARWKDWGNFEINQGRQIQDIMFNTDSKLDQARNFSMKMAGAMDSLTWGRIWNACELEVMDKRPTLTRGSAAFNETVARRFTDVVDQTQVVDNVLGRSQIMRSGDNLAKMATSYMGEPTQSYNLVYRAFRDWSQEQDSAKRTAAMKQLGRAVAALTASQFVNAIAQSLWDAVRDDEDRDKKYWERVLGNILPNFADNANPLGMVPYVRDVLSVLQGYDVKRMDMEAITSFISACQNMNKAIDGEGRYTLAGASANLIAEAARISGLPAATVKRDLVAIARSVGVETGDWYFQYQIEKALNSVGYSGNRGEFYNIAFGALRDGEMDVYQQITLDLMNSGVKAASIESAMRERLKAAKEKDKSFRLNQQAMDLLGVRTSYASPQENPETFGPASLGADAYQQYATRSAETYRGWSDEIQRGSAFSTLPDTVKDSALDAARKLAEDLALLDVSGGQFTGEDLSQWERWASGGGDYGVDETEAILFKVAYEMSESDKDEEGRTISGSKKENTLEAVYDLMPWLTDQELSYLMANYWTPEDAALKALKEGKFMP